MVAKRLLLFSPFLRERWCIVWLLLSFYWLYQEALAMPFFFTLIYAVIICQHLLLILMLHKSNYSPRRKPQILPITSTTHPTWNPKRQRVIIDAGAVGFPMHADLPSFGISSPWPRCVEVLLVEMRFVDLFGGTLIEWGKKVRGWKFKQNEETQHSMSHPLIHIHTPSPSQNHVLYPRCWPWSQ